MNKDGLVAAPDQVLFTLFDIIWFHGAVGTERIMDYKRAYM